MEFTGWDTVVFTTQTPQLVFEYVLTVTLSRWPEVLVENLEAPNSQVMPGKAVNPEGLPGEESVLLFVRDEVMSSHMEKHGYALMSDGDGPFALWARKRREVIFKTDTLQELHDGNDATRALMVEPYSAWIISPWLYELTLVTPGDPRSEPFSMWTLQVVRQACGIPS